MTCPCDRGHGPQACHIMPQGYGVASYTPRMCLRILKLGALLTREHHSFLLILQPWQPFRGSKSRLSAFRTKPSRDGWFVFSSKKEMGCFLRVWFY